MGTKITDLPQMATPTGFDELPISQDNGIGGRDTYKATLDQIKNYVKNTGGGTGTVTSVGVSSTDGSIEVFGSPIIGAGTITLSISSVGLDKLDDGGATGGQVLTYDDSTTTWIASAVPKELPQTASNGNILTYDGSANTWVASSLSANGFNVLLSSNGYTYLPNGLIMQWGRIYASSLLEQAITIQYPISFTNSIYSLIPTLSTNTTTSNGGNMSLYVKDMNLNEATIWADSDSPTFTNSYILWQAIGY